MSTQLGPMPAIDEAEALVIETLRQELQGLGLPLYQARVFAALLHLGTANSIQLAWVSRIPRTSIYQVMRALEAQGLLERVPAPGPVSWTCQDRQMVVEALEAAAQDRMQQYEGQLRRLRQLLAVTPPRGPQDKPVPPQRLASQPSQRRAPQQGRAKERMERILDAAEELFAEVGCDVVTTTQIATRAATSIGSLYEFFGSKHAVAKALSERYLREFDNLFDESLATGAPDGVGALVDVIHDVYSRSPGLRPLLNSSAGPEDLQTACMALKTRLVDGLDRRFKQLRPAADPLHRHAVAEMCGFLLWSVVGEIVTSRSKEQATLLAELKLALNSYAAASHLTARTSHDSSRQ